MQPGGSKRDMDEAVSKREAILAAAGEVFFERGYEAATTLDIATKAKTSKRALYQHFPSKEAILAELIRSRSRQMQAPVEIPPPKSRSTFFDTLRTFGVVFLSQLLQPNTIALYRLAIGEAGRSAQIGHELKLSGQGPVVEAVRRLMEHGAGQGFLRRDDIDLAVDAFFHVLIGPLQMGLLLRTEKQPSRSTLHLRADRAIAVLQHLFT
jgi:AcrR family transcriptional regulator